MTPELDPTPLAELAPEAPPPAIDAAARRAARAALAEGRATLWLPLGLLGATTVLYAAIAVRELARLFG